jgi:hypothetical protein
VSVWVHALPSLHSVPFATGVFTHMPVVLLQAALWHWSTGVHVPLAPVAVQTPLALQA